MLRPALKTLALIVLLSGAADARAADEVGEVPFKFEKGYVIVAGTIKGKEPVELIVSTGAEYSTVDSGMLDKHKLQLNYTSVGVVTGFNDRTVTFANVPDVHVGPANASLRMHLGSTAQAAKGVGRDIFGVLGSDFFKGRTVQFDFKKRVMRFLDKDAAEVLRAKAAGVPETAVLPMALLADAEKQHLTLPLVEKVTFNGKAAKLLLDTGTATVVALTASAGKKLGFDAPPEKGAPRNDAVASLRFGGYEMAGVPVMVFPKGSPAEERLGESGAAAGSALLQNFIVTFDFRGKVVILEHL
jgi:hypothetical protein